MPYALTECLQATPSVDSSSSLAEPVYYTATFPATILSWFKLDLKERTTTNKIKHEPAQTAHATANVSLLAEVSYCSFNGDISNGACHVV